MAQIIPISGGYEVWDKGELIARVNNIYTANKIVRDRS